MSTWTHVRDALVGVVPGLAGAVTGPLGPVVQASLAHVLKVENTPDAVHAAVTNADPDTLLKLKQLDFDKESLYVKDGADARSTYVQTRNPLTNWLAVGIVVASGYVIGAVVTGHAVGLKDPTMAATAGTVVGYLFRELKHVLSFFFGASGDDSK